VARHPDDDREIIYLERESSSTLKPLLLGLALGLGAGLLFAPRSGEDTRRALRRRLRRLRALAGEQVGELSERLQDGVDRIRTGEWPIDEDGEDDDEAATAEAPPVSSARQELERRLAAARARRRGAASGDEEPVA
jgi:gas vesicle protein